MMICKQFLIPGQLSGINRIFVVLKHYSTKPGEIYNPYKVKNVPKGIWSDENDPRFTKTEVVEGKWHFVEQLFPKIRIPEPPKKVSSSGWRAPAEKIPDLPYFVERSRNHMLPVYEARMYKDKVLCTTVDGVQGDIWVFEYDLKRYLEKTLSQKVESHVNEASCAVNVKGNHIEIIKEWLYDKGF